MDFLDLKQMKYKIEKTCDITPEIQRKANAIARKRGYGTASQIVLGKKDKILEHIPYGYRKYTTGEYVPHAYRKNFGWKNTYYQEAYTLVMIAL